MTDQQAVVVHVSDGSEAAAGRDEMIVRLDARQLADAADGQRKRRRRLRDGRLLIVHAIERKFQSGDVDIVVVIETRLVVNVVVVEVEVIVTLHREEGVRGRIRRFLCRRIFLKQFST